MKNINFSKWKKWLAPVIILIVGIIGGLLGAFILLKSSGVNFKSNSSTSPQVTTSKNVYNNSSDTTKAVKTVQDAVVSIINYQNSSSSDSLSDFYGGAFGGDDNSSSSSDSDKDDLDPAGSGSGVIYKKDGDTAYVVTNNHVIDGAKRIEVMLANGTKVVGELVGADTYSDLAVVKISSKDVSTVAEFADSDKLTVGETAIAIGSPLGVEYANSVTEGIVSSLSRTVTMKNEDGETISTNAIQTDAAINPGNSGGALVNIEGQVIGINSSKITLSGVEGMGFAIPSNDVIKIISQLVEDGKVTRPAMGISMANLSELSTSAISELGIPEDITAGVVVTEVQSGMPADGKLKQYDVITAIDGEEVTSTTDFQTLLYNHEVGDSIEITFYRGKDKKTVTIELTKSEDDLSK
ncbi:S1C family serine protease [Streptococcus dentiloxodontae]